MNTAIQRTVYADEIVDMLSFVNLSNLGARMSHEKVLNTEYRGVISYRCQYRIAKSQRCSSDDFKIRFLSMCIRAGWRDFAQHYIFTSNPPQTFDAILMDVMMPVMNGYEATRKIRSLQRADAKDIPIIAITANAFTEDVESALKAGMNDHLAKPLNTQKMISTIAKYVND